MRKGRVSISTAAPMRNPSGVANSSSSLVLENFFFSSLALF